MKKIVAFSAIIIAISIVFLSIYILLTGNYAILSYVQLLLGIMLFILGLNEVKEQRKLSALFIFLIAVFNLLVGVYVYIVLI